MGRPGGSNRVVASGTEATYGLMLMGLGGCRYLLAMHNRLGSADWSKPFCVGKQV